MCCLLAALSMQLLQQRTLLGTIEGAEDNVDLGAFLTRLSAVTTGSLKTKLNATLAAYRAAVVAYGRDGILADVSLAAPGFRHHPQPMRRRPGLLGKECRFSRLL